MSSLTGTKGIAWSQRARNALKARGYYYEPEFCTDVEDASPVLTAARILGHLYIPSGTSPRLPVIITKPTPSAPEWRPFDRPASIGWHNDFSTRSRRPQLSFSWILQGGPPGTEDGTWRVASTFAVLSKLCQTREGKRLVDDLSTRAEPFGYRDAGRWYPFRVITRVDGRPRAYGLRFYGRALKEGACLRFGQITDHTLEIVAKMQEAADAVGEVLCASRGALLIVDNRFSLHDRMEQQVTGPAEQRRQACLCFITQLHRPL